MTETPPSTSASGPTTASSPGMTDELRMLRRSRSNRVIAGVLGGLGQRLGIDPILLRVALAVLVVFGGVGVLLYAIAWLLMPAEDDSASVLDQAIGRREVRDASAVPLALGLGSVILITSGIAIGTSWNGKILLVLAVVGLYVLLRRRSDEPPATAASGWPGGEPSYVYDAAAGSWTLPDDVAATPGAAGWTVPTQGASRSTTEPVSEPDPDTDHGPGVAEPPRPDATTDAPTTPSRSPDVTGPLPPGTQGWPEGPDWQPAGRAGTSPYDDLYLARDSDAQPPQRTEPHPSVLDEPRPRSVLGMLTVCTAVVATGLVAVADAMDVGVAGPAYIAVPLAVVAIGLLLGAWFGRSRGLIFLGILLTLALVPAAVAERWDLSAGPVELVAAPDLADLSTVTVTHGLGPVEYDLSQLEMADGDEVTITVQVAMGTIEVLVPPEVDVVVNSSVGAGSLDVFDNSQGGFGRTETITDLGPDGTGGGRIELDLEIGMGAIEVSRADLDGLDGTASHPDDGSSADRSGSSDEGADR
ncbi:PspC domain-containing protein [Phytoactinopolyspora limicola]|uniref:PspC domain-containing protein n=1 Tax=Phytoactinopolyspora limicola TaxID=2715536 RepID=UPI001408A1FA|nr:PspC domain-containing protein [Phytoactinopolyspora limicola]